ncbi:1457_t:CDS:10 [Paraglomus brasilianum]|uniref:General negative regulator of transcription subunit n=1 Tax=Paraglomus brasilianum TaxID=144538 RepID=A0A9N9C7M9_9GLOM|nr:1457_t:CDS:10 [Paraglomus brasilianum]
MANRKLQTEIDRVLKKVAEGVESFEGIFEKIQSTSNANQKEKLEQDLKKDIKKLQRHRDQIKTWISSNDIKDKKALIDNRRLIEQQMEKFKACEKEMKTKAYSKEGLSQSAKMDPKEKEKLETTAWLSDMVDQLALQIEAAEAKAESLHAVIKKGRKDQQKLEDLNEAENLVERHKWHTGRLELILRLLENGNITTEQVLDIQEDIKYYAESNQDPDFEEDEHIYDGLNLEEEEEIYGRTGDDHHSSHDSVTDEPQTPQKEHSPSMSPTARTTAPINKPTIPVPTRKASVSNALDSTSRPKEEEKPKLPPPIPSSNVQSPPSTSAYASVKAMQGGPRIITKGAPEQMTTSAQTPTVSSTGPSATAPHQPQPPLRYAAFGLSQSSPEAEQKKYLAQYEIDSSNQQPIEPPMKPTLSTSIASAFSATAFQQLASATPISQTIQPRDATATVSNLAVGQQSSSMQATEDLSEQSSEQETQHVIPDVSREGPHAESRFPASLTDLVASFEAAKEKSLSKDNRHHVQQMLDVSFQHVPESADAERPKYYAPRNPYPTSQYYPTTPLSVFDNPMLFEKFGLDSLFFIFYYQQGTYQQYLAARELKKQSWRFHKKYLTWFQRHEEPKAMTDEYEQGTYIYFDYEGAWCQRKKTEFRFEYRFLEDAELV